MAHMVLSHHESKITIFESKLHATEHIHII